MIIVELTQGHILIMFGLGFIISGLLVLLAAIRYEDNITAEKILFTVLSIFGILFIISGLNVDYGFIVFRMVE